MSAICPVCASSSLRGQFDADIVRKISLRKIAECHKLSICAVKRHLKHLPEVLETEGAAPSTAVIAPTYNNITVNLFVVGSYAEEEEGEGVAANEALPGN